MSKRITIIDGHPDADPARFLHALAGAYADGARAAGHEVRLIEVAKLDMPVLRTRHDWADEPPPPAALRAQADLAWAEHVAIFYPLWLGDMPALMKAFLEQVMRPGFAIREGVRPDKAGLLKGRSAHLVVTMGMPAFFYRFFYGAHSLKSFERNILKLVGISPVRHSIIGNVEGSAEDRKAWLDEMFGAGEAAL